MECDNVDVGIDQMEICHSFSVYIPAHSTACTLLDIVGRTVFQTCPVRHWMMALVA